MNVYTRDEFINNLIRIVKHPNLIGEESCDMVWDTNKACDKEVLFTANINKKEGEILYSINVPIELTRENYVEAVIYTATINKTMSKKQISATLVVDKDKKMVFVQRKYYFSEGDIGLWV